ncbi:MAG: hypothetical protein JWN40_548 [Phycisphaerales bacterium]|nr:hypothetical protein [Phycisphaerales bacterium]
MMRVMKPDSTSTWKGLSMSNLNVVEQALMTQSFQFAQVGNYESARKLMGLAERTKLLKSEIEAVDPVVAALMGAPRSVTGADNTYPRFWVERDVLRKMGLGRDGKSTYVHGIPKTDFNEVVRKLGELANENETFAVREFVKDVGMPDYHPYIVISVMEELGLLEATKRGTMRFIDRAAFARRATGAWQELSQRPIPKR